jgi:hypothetical protein
MQGLSAYYGNPITEDSAQNLELAGLGRMLALSADPARNALAAMHYRHEFGQERVYGLRVQDLEDLPDRLRIAGEFLGRELFAVDVSYTTLADRLHQGQTLRATRLSEAFGFEDLMHQSAAQAIALFAIDPKGRLQVFTSNHPPSPRPVGR